MKTQPIRIKFPQEMYDALQKKRRETGTPLSDLIRQFVAEGLAKEGIIVTSTVQWGGNHESKNEP